MGGGGGGGGGGTRGKAGDEASSLFDSGSGEALPGVTPSGRRNVFISFHTQDEAQVNLLRNQARAENSQLDFRDYSVKEPFDEAWKSNCRERISQTSATICMIGRETAGRAAVLWELEESYRQGKKVIGVRINRNANDPVPEILKKHRAPIVNWNLAEIQQHLERD
jgi:hypothetical protein